ncbi:hypothetical protein WJX72_003750 [[Myrmecia] bisecta]|uniref:C3H1-type domain-containing protein n=1 Tax=[Myrmecia] bisecta TaxID=41462 RepID=A0AAW1R6C2_9CHLO
MASSQGIAQPAGKQDAFDLEDAEYASDQFRIYSFKVKRCPRARPHDWTQCPFSHPGEKAKRRDPRRYKYSGTACPEFRKNGSCRRGDACPFAHGVFECWLHPARYRTQTCTDGTACKRRVCFFAHVPEELRKPEGDTILLTQQMQAELAAEAQALQQQQLTQTLTALLGAQAGSNALPTGQNGQLLNMEMLAQLAANTALAPPASEASSPPQANIIQERTRLLQLQLSQLHQLQIQNLQRQQAQQQLLHGPLGGADTATLEALQAQIAQAQNVLMQQQLQQQVEQELNARSSFDGSSRRSFDASSRSSFDAGRSSFDARRSSLDPPRPVRGSFDGVVRNGYDKPARASFDGARASFDSAFGSHVVSGQRNGGILGPDQYGIDPALVAALQSMAMAGGNGRMETVNEDSTMLGTMPFPAHRPAHRDGRRSIDNGSLMRQMSKGLEHGYAPLDPAMMRAGKLGPISTEPRELSPNGSRQSSPATSAGTPPKDVERPPMGQSQAAIAASEAAVKNARVLLEGFHMMQGKNGVTITPQSLADTSDMDPLMVRNTSFDRILSELPRSLSQVDLVEQLNPNGNPRHAVDAA